jgi:ATP-dependent Clp protease ATP-binding subunit ClpX
MSTQKSAKSIPICSFCGADAGDSLLVRGQDLSHICESCIDECTEIVKEQRNKKEMKSSRPSLTPASIKKHLDQYVVGQDEAKKLISIAIYCHYKRINKYDTGGVEIQKSNILLLGPTGSGKTHMVKHLAKLLKVPVSISDATSVTQAGYVGDDVESILSRLVMSANGNIELAQKGIVYVDEVDKIAKVASDRGRDVSGEGVQQGLLKILEGSEVFINPEGGKKNSMTKEVSFKTDDVLFICGGAFSGISESRKKRKLGLSEKETHEDPNAPIESKDLVKFGLIPEFVGRLPVIAQLNQLSVDDLVKILTETKNNLADQYKALLKIDGVKIDFSDGFLRKVAQKAQIEGTGARGLRTIMEKNMQEIMFKGPELKDKEITLTEEDFKE